MSQSFAELGTLITDRLRELDAVIESAKGRITQAMCENEGLAEPFIGKVDAAKFLNMSVSTLELRMAERDGPPRYIDGGKVNFLRSELKSWRAKWRIGKP